MHCLLLLTSLFLQLIPFVKTILVISTLTLQRFRLILIELVTEVPRSLHMSKPLLMAGGCTLRMKHL